jgi:hypothetical protein
MRATDITTFPFLVRFQVDISLASSILLNVAWVASRPCEKASNISL